MSTTNSSSTLSFSGSYSLTSATLGTNSAVSPNPTLTGDPEFVTFARKEFTLLYVQGTNTSITLEAPCTKTASPTLNYAINSLPNWLYFTPNSASSTQTITSNATVNFGGADFLDFNGTLCNTAPYNSFTKCWDFWFLLFKCPDTSCTECLSFNYTANRGICTVCDSTATLADQRCTPKCGNGVNDSPEQCDDSNTSDGDGCSSTC